MTLEEGPRTDEAQKTLEILTNEGFFIAPIVPRSLQEFHREEPWRFGYVSVPSDALTTTPLPAIAAVKPSSLVLPESNLLTYAEQDKMIQAYGEELKQQLNLPPASEIARVNASVSYQLDRAYQEQTGEPLLQEISVFTSDEYPYAFNGTQSQHAVYFSRRPYRPQLNLRGWNKEVKNPDAFAMPVVMIYGKRTTSST